MANNITEYNATPGSNTTIDSISIDEGMAASNVNNAIRSLMSHLKNVDTGSQALTALSVAGSVTATTSLKTPLIEFTDGDNALTIADGGNVTANADLTVTGDLVSNTAGTSNFRAGVNAGNSIASGGNYNTVIGDEAGTAITTGDENVMIGYVAGDAIDTSSQNVAVGAFALTADTKGSKSVAIGRGALNAQNFTSATDANNVAVGDKAGYAITTGTSNTIVGATAGEDLTTGGNNVVIGNRAGEEMTTADDNVFIGRLSGGGNAGGATTGNDNVCIGAGAGSSLTTGTRNTIVGKDTGNNGVQATDNIVIGQGSVFSSIDRSQSTMIGNGMTSQGTNTFLFGYGSSDTLCSFGSTSFSNPSDERYKEEIETSTAGLSFINDLRPVTFKWKKEKDIPSDHRAYKADSEDRVMLSDGKTQHGFIAQEVKTAIDNHSEIKDGFEGWNQDETDGRQRTSAIALIPMLVKAIQELSTEVTALKTENATQATQIADLINRITALENA